MSMDKNGMNCQETVEQIGMEGFEPTAKQVHDTKSSRKFESKLPEKVSHGIGLFFELFAIAAILHKCNIATFRHGGTGITPSNMFRFLFEQLFSDRSTYRLEKDGQLPEGVSTSSVSRFLSHGGYNWEKFLTLLGEKATTYINDLNDPGKPAILAMDDTDHDKNPRKRLTSGDGKPNKKKKKRAHKGHRTELVSCKYDHARKRKSFGFRMLTIIWTDATSVIPLAFSLLSSQKKEKIVGDIKKFHKNSLQYKRRNMAVSKTTDVMIDLIKRALRSVKASYIAADRWFSDPATIYAIKTKCGIDVIAPLKHCKTKYKYNDQMLTINRIHKMIKKKHGISKWHASIIMDMYVSSGNKRKKDIAFPVKVVFVHNRAKHGDWIAFASTDTSLTEDEIIVRYAMRFDIEHMFKCIKYSLGLTTKCHAMSYDAIVAHSTIVLTAYLLLVIEKRKAEDKRTLGEIMYLIEDQMEEMKIGKALLILEEAVFDVLENTLHLTDEQLDTFIDGLLEKLPEHIREALSSASSADPRELDAI